VYTLFVPPTCTLFHQFLQFCWRENLRDHKKDIAFLLVWDKDSYTERFLGLPPCTCVLQSSLVHFYQTYLLLLGLIPIVAPANLRLLYLLLNKEHINHIWVLGFLPFAYSTHVCSPLSVWPTPNNITAFVLGLYSAAYEREHVIFGLLSLANLA
jgi:hypothetical protein